MILTAHEFSTRPLGEESIPDLLALYRQCEDFLALGPETTASESMIRRDLVTTQPEGGTFCGIFLPDGTLAGVLDVIPGGFEGQPAQAFIELLMIARPYRGRGLGQAVVRALVEALRAGPARAVLAGVQVNNPRALAFWQRQGFRVISGPALQADGTTSVMTRREIW
jgi:ribosomal protein S18 acetylase RimI-like enzyme